jgi:hypothetical protein
MKYKLLQNLPDVKAGVIIDKFRINDYGQNIFSIKGHIFNEIDMRHNPEWFAPYLFKIDCGEYLFVGDEFYVVYCDEITYWHDEHNTPVSQIHIASYNTPKYDMYKYFSTKEKAEQYLESLKPKFKVGDIVVFTNVNGSSTHKITKLNTQGVWCSNGNYYLYEQIRLANESEVLKYYEQQGWVKGAKFKYGDKIYTLEYLVVRENLVFVGEGKISYVIDANINNCELIKEPDYPKSLEEVKSHILETNYSTEFSRNIVTGNSTQYDSLLAFSLLTVLHKAMIDEYNRVNNCDWHPDWNDGLTEKYSVIRLCSYLDVSDYINIYNPLSFPSRELAEFSLLHHENLWKQYYEL